MRRFYPNYLKLSDVGARARRDAGRAVTNNPAQQNTTGLTTVGRVAAEARRTGDQRWPPPQAGDAGGGGVAVTGRDAG